MRLCTKGGSEKLDGKGRVAGLALAVALMLAALSGCTTSSGSHVVYIVGGTNSVSGYRINNGTWSASVLQGTPYVAGNSPSSVAVHPSGQFLYVANAIDSTI